MLGDDKEQHIINASLFFDVHFACKMPGDRAELGQALAFPRVGMTNIHGEQLEDRVTPLAVERCVALFALADVNAPLFRTVGTASQPETLTEKTVKLGPIETTIKYDKGVKQSKAMYEQATAYLRSLIKGSTNNQRRTIRA